MIRCCEQGCCRDGPEQPDLEVVGCSSGWGTSISVDGVITIAVGCDDSYALPLAVTLNSSLRNLNSERRVEIYLMDVGITTDSRRRLNRVVEAVRPDTILVWVSRPQLEEALRDMKAYHWISIAGYSRLMIPSVVPATRSRVIYLDSDVLVRGDLEGLWQSEVSHSQAIAAVGDFGYSKRSEILGEACDLFGLDPASRYFNTGVMVMNLQIWRTQNLGSETLGLIRENPLAFKYPDQDCLNLLIGSNWSQLAESWNVQLSVIDRHLKRFETDESEVARRKVLMIDGAQILHFTGSRKPWHPRYRSVQSKHFLAELARSGWFDSAAERTRWFTGFRAKRTYWRLHRHGTRSFTRRST